MYGSEKLKQFDGKWFGRASHDLVFVDDRQGKNCFCEFCCKKNGVGWPPKTMQNSPIAVFTDKNFDHGYVMESSNLEIDSKKNELGSFSRDRKRPLFVQKSSERTSITFAVAVSAVRGDAQLLVNLVVGDPTDKVYSKRPTEERRKGTKNAKKS